MKRLVFVCLFSFLLPLTIQATERYASTSGSGSTCSLASPCSLSTGLAATVAGDTLWLRGGNYGVNLSNGAFTFHNGTSWSNPVLVKAYNNEVPQFAGGVLNGYGGPVEYIILDGLLFHGAGGFQLQGPGVKHNRIINCEVRNSSGNGIEGFSYFTLGADNGTDNQLINNHIHHNGNETGEHGFYGAMPNMLIEGNIIHDNSGYGLQVYDQTPGDSSGTIIRNNTIYNNDTAVVGWNGCMTVGFGTGMQVYNNTCAGHRNGIQIAYGAPYGHPATNVGVYNNTIYGMGGVGAGIIVYDADVVGTIVRNNIVYNVATPISNNGTSTTQDHNLSTDPSFEDAAGGNFKLLAGSAARNAGVTIASFSTDKDGVGRPQGTAWDIGAYEYPESGGASPNGNPIYIAKTGLDSWSCTDAEDPAKAKLTLTSAICECAKFPGKRHIIKAGTYTESLDTGVCGITGGLGPSYTNATTIETFGNDAVTIKSAAGYGMALWLRASESYIVFKGSVANRLIFDGTGGNGNVVALYPGTHHIKFEYVAVTHADLYENVYALNANNIEWYDSLIHDAALDGIAADGTTDGWIIQRTLLYSNGRMGLKAPANTGTTTGLRLSESKIYSNADDGVEIGSSTGVTLVNNVYYANGGLGVQLKTGAVGAKVYNSSLYQDAVQCDSGATSAEIKNVISYGTGSGITNNCSASTATNYTSDPLYTNAAAGDLTLQNGSQAINAGTALAGVTIDYAGSPRPDVTNGLVDIGAYERCCPDAPAPPGTSATVPGDRRRHAGMLF